MGDFFLKKLRRLEEDLRHCKKMVENVRRREDFDQIAATLQKINNEMDTLVQIRRQFVRAGYTAKSVVVTDDEGNIEYVDDKFTRLIGYTTREVIGKNLGY